MYATYTYTYTDDGRVSFTSRFVSSEAIRIRLRHTGATEWMPKWERNGWLRADGKKVQNRRELTRLARELAASRVRWVLGLALLFTRSLLVHVYCTVLVLLLQYSTEYYK